MFNSKITEEQSNIFRQKLADLDLSIIKWKILLTEDLNRDTIDIIEKWYKNFLFLNYKYSDNYRIVPHELIDLFWHNHILDTRKYAKDCMLLFNGPLHHYPYFGMKDAEDRELLNASYELTKEMFLLEFGEIPFYTKSLQTTNLYKKPLLVPTVLAGQGMSSCYGIFRHSSLRFFGI
jgi:hypothetical protein